MEWMKQALCQDNHKPWFSTDPFVQHQAIVICSHCEVREECLEYALEKGIWGGIFGGLTDDDRKRYAKQQGSPRHRTLTGYTVDSCKCDLCREEMREYDRSKRPRRTKERV